MASQPPPAGYDWVDEPAPARAPLRPLIQRAPSPQTQAQAQADQGRAAAAPYDAPRAQADIQRTQQQIQQTNTRGANFGDENSLRNQYQALPAIRDYQTVAPMVQRAQRAAPGGAGDLNIVYSYAKVMDPGSVVRESEVQMSQGTGGLGDQINGYLQSLRNGGRLTPNVRNRLLREIESSAGVMREAYRQARKQYWRNAEDYGFEPTRIIGGDVDEAFQGTPNADAPAAVPLPGATVPAGGDPAGFGSQIIPQALQQAEQAGAIPPAANAPGQVTRTNIGESALGGIAAGEGVEDTTGTSASPRYVTDQDRIYNEQFAAAASNPNVTREDLNQGLQQYYPLLYPGRPVPTVDDATWRMIEESRRTGTPLQFDPRATGVNDEEYRNQAEGREGAAARETWAEENPTLAAIDTVGRTAANTVTLGAADRLAGAANGTSAAYEHGVTNTDWRDRPLESLGGAVAGSVVLPYGRTAPRQIGAGAAYGGITDYNNTDGSQGDRLRGAYRGILTGGATNAAMSGATRAFRSPNADAVIAAGERQGVTIPRYMTGRETAQVATGAVGATPGRIPLARAANRTIEGLTNARNRVAAEIGDVGDEFEAGRRAQSGARDFIRRSGDRADQLFQRIPIRPETPAELTNTRQALDELTAGLSSNPRLSGLLEDRRLVAFRDALQSGQLSWGDQRRFRSLIGEMIGQPQVAGEVTSRASLRRLYGALTDDMQATAASQGPRALTSFNRANQYYRGREARREGVIQDILGADGQAAPEDAFRTINRWAQRGTGDSTSLARTMRSLPRDDANAVRATVFSRMGRANSSGQDETGAVFSPQTFATQWDKLDPRARAMLVPNRAHRRNLDDIALLASAMRRSERFTNTSNTGLGANLGMFTLGGMTNLPAAAGAAATTYGLGHMLASPAGSRSILRALRNPEAYRGIAQGEEEE